MDKKPRRLVFKPEVRARTGLSDTTIWRKMREQTFPLSLDMGGRTAWYEDEIDDWMNSLPRSTLKPASEIEQKVGADRDAVTA